MKNYIQRISKELLVIISICGTFLVTYFLFSFASFYLNTSSQFSEIQQSRKVNLEALANSLENYLTGYFTNQNTSNHEVLCPFVAQGIKPQDLETMNHLADLLKTLTNSGNINFSVLKYKGQTQFTTRGTTYLCGIDPKLEADYRAVGRVEVLNTVMLRTVDAGHFKLTMGIPILTGRHVINEFLTSIAVFFNDTLLLTLLLTVIIAFYLNDLIFLYRIIGKGNWKQLLRERVAADGSKTLVRFIGSMLLVADDLEIQNEKLKHGFEDAYLRHIVSAEFKEKLSNVVYIELDWKNHTPYVTQYGLNEIIPIRNRINHMGRVIVGRYGGFVLEAKSDMVSFIMETESVLENKLLAIACSRDFFETLDHLETQLSNKDIKVKYRGTMVVGDLEFEVTEHNYNLNSFVYYIASRLSKISKAPGHNVTLLAKDVEGLDGLTLLSEPQTEILKGLGPQSYCEVDSFISVETVIEAQRFSLLKYFRSEQDLLRVLRFCLGLIQQGEFSRVREVVAAIHGFQLGEFLTSTEIPGVYMELMTATQKNCDEYTVAAVISLAKVLLKVGRESQVVIEHLRIVAQTPLSRVRANTIDVYNWLTDYQDQKWNESHFEFKNNRVQANVIMGACQSEISSTNKDRIQRFVNSQEERYIASGLYLMGHLYRAFKKKNLVYFANDDWFKAALEELRRFVDHPSSMVSQRAKIELSGINLPAMVGDGRISI